MSNNKYTQVDFTTYQERLLLDFNFGSKDILFDDLFLTVLEIIERIDLSKYIDFSKVKNGSYDPKGIFTVILFSYALKGYSSLRELEEMCRYDARCRLIMQGEVPSYKTFERFINNVLKEKIKEINKDVCLYIQDKKS